MTSFTIYTNLFTLKHKPVEENLYICMYIVWLIYLIESQSLSKEDIHVLVVDERTLEYLKQRTSFSTLARSLPSQIQILKTVPPESLLEGCMYKYLKIPFATDCLMYCDIDILPVQSLRKLFEDELNPGLYVHKEGFLSNPNYSGTLFDHSMLSEGTPGLSAGKFVIVGQDIYSSFFESFQELLKSPSEEWKTYYTLEQPLFNKVCYTLKDKGVQLSTLLFKKPHLLTNSFLANPDTTLLDFCGEPGNASFHFLKIFNTFIHMHFGDEEEQDKN